MTREKVMHLVRQIVQGEQAMAELLAAGLAPPPPRGGPRGGSFARSEVAQDAIPKRVYDVFVARGVGKPTHLDDLCRALPRVLRTSICSACGQLIEDGKVRRTSLGWYELVKK